MYSVLYLIDFSQVSLRHWLMFVHTFSHVAAFSHLCVHVWFCVPLCSLNVCLSHPCDRPPDHAQSSYRVSADGSFLVTLASGMELSLITEPLLPGGAGGGVSPTASRCNISLPGDHAPSLIEWRQRKEQSKTNYSTYERRLRVKHQLILQRTQRKSSHLNSLLHKDNMH